MFGNRVESLRFQSFMHDSQPQTTFMEQLQNSCSFLHLSFLLVSHVDAFRKRMIKMNHSDPQMKIEWPKRVIGMRKKIFT